MAKFYSFSNVKIMFHLTYIKELNKLHFYHQSEYIMKVCSNDKDKSAISFIR